MKQPKNSRFRVGRAGHDPATYGLKGHPSNVTPRRVSQVAVNGDGTRELRVNRPAWLDEARAHLRANYPADGLSESLLWALHGAGFGIVGDEVLS